MRISRVAARQRSRSEMIAAPWVRTVEIDFGKGFAQPLAFLTDCAIGRGFGERRQPIEDSKPGQREQVVGPVKEFGGETTEHGAAFSGSIPYRAIMPLDLTDDETAAARPASPAHDR